MASTAVASNTIVLEVLDQQNYQDWSSRVKTYLSAKDLWDVVIDEPPAEPKDGEPDDEQKAWMKKNAKALHAIKVSCGTDMFSIIREAPTAKIAWDDLEQAYQSHVHRLQSERKEEQADTESSRDSSEELESTASEGEENYQENYPDYNSIYDDFFKYVGAGEWDNAKEYLATTLHDDSNVLRARHPKSGYTALQFAAKKGRLDVVRQLLQLMTKEEDMEIADDDGYTPLHEAVYKEHLEIVKELMQKMRSEGLGIPNSKGATALHTAAKLGNVEIVKELVTKMRKEDLEIRNDKYFTALGYALVARNVGDDKCSEEKIIKMAEYMVNKNQKILTIVLPPQNLIPVVEACSDFKWDVARYLSSVTPLEALISPDNESQRQGATLLCCCLEQKKFDIARNLLLRCPRLATVADLRGDDGDNSPILVLSRTRPVFLRDIMQLRFWQKWIYHSISRYHPDVSTNVSNSDNDQASHKDLLSSTLSIQAPADSNLDEVSINVSNSELNQGSQEHLLNSVLTLPPPANSEVNQGTLAHHSPVMLYRRLAKGVRELLGINRINEIKSSHDRIIECIRCMGKASDGQLDLDIVKKSIFEAVKQGDADFVAHLGNENRQLIDVDDDKDRTIFHMAIECRQEEIYNLLYGLSEERRKEFGCKLTGDGNSMLHSAATLSPLSSSFNHIQGASLQMQRELQWFEEVGSVVPQGMHEYRNTIPTEKLPARELFHNNHQKLMEEAEKSMKGMAASCTVVGSLIITIMFAAAFTVPGGTDSTTGFPVFVNRASFMVYIIADTVSLVTSTTSVLICLGILTSRYAEKDFLENLPRKMMIGLITLFVSITTMMMAFYCGLVMMLRGKHSWVVIPATVVASVPVISFAWMLFPLLVQTFISTYGHGIFRKKVKCQQWSKSTKL